VIAPACLVKAQQKLAEGCAWVAILTDDDGAWIYSSGAKIEDVAEEIADMTYQQRMEYLVSGVLEMEEHAEDVTP
jgi:outer membrane protease